MQESEPSVLNLLSLARTSPGRPQALPGSGVDAVALEEPLPLRLERPLFLVVLAGELIVDLPHGDFRILKVGDAVRLERDLEVVLTPVVPTVALRTAVG